MKILSRSSRAVGTKVKIIFRKSHILVGAAFFAGIIFVVQKISPHTPAPETLSSVRLPAQAVSALPSVKIGAASVAVEIATTSAAVERGLSGRASLGQDQGMLFIFSQPDRWRFWMPDMRFPIDIIWIAGERVVDIDENVSNRFDPAHPVFFAPSVPVRHVLEVNAGFSRMRGIGIGDPVIFYHPK